MAIVGMAMASIVTEAVRAFAMARASPIAALANAGTGFVFVAAAGAVALGSSRALPACVA